MVRLKYLNKFLFHLFYKSVLNFRTETGKSVLKFRTSGLTWLIFFGKLSNNDVCFDKTLPDARTVRPYQTSQGKPVVILTLGNLVKILWTLRGKDKHLYLPIQTNL